MKLMLPKTTLDLSNQTRIMGILNVTPDSFSDGGKYNSLESSARHATNMVEDGADIIDVGGESTRPGSESISISEELDRVIPVIEKLNNICPIISIDTVKPEVADEALKAGAQIVKDISGLQFHPEIGTVISTHNAAVVLMHIQGKPQTMQNHPEYNNVIDDIKIYFRKSLKIAKDSGIQSDQILLDPGIGFGKSIGDNLEIIKHLEDFDELQCPILIGVSRKSFIGQITGKPISDRLTGTLAAVSASVLNGAKIVRVHDVKEVKETIMILDQLKN